MYKLDLELEEDKVYLLAEDKIIVGHNDNEFYCFWNTEIDPWNFDYNDIKNLSLTKIPNRVQILLSFYDRNDEYIKELDVVPYPFNYIYIIRENDVSSIILSSNTEGRDWKIRWSIEPFFNELIKTVSNFSNVDIILDEKFSYEEERVSLKFNILDDVTIDKAINNISIVTKEIIEETKLALTGLSKFQKIINIWQLNRENTSEEFWQSLLMKYSWIIGQSLSLPLIIFHDKAYMGGKDISNKNGGVIDFAYKNNFTNNIVLIEIKTPQTSLVGKEYRQTHSLSSELTGSINQILLYKDSCQKDFASLVRRSKDRYEPFNPKCLLIIGSVSSLREEEKIAFELFRSELKSVEIITFDELFEKIKILLDISRDIDF